MSGHTQLAVRGVTELVRVWVCCVVYVGAYAIGVVPCLLVVTARSVVLRMSGRTQPTISVAPELVRVRVCCVAHTWTYATQQTHTRR